MATAYMAAAVAIKSSSLIWQLPSLPLPNMAAAVAIKRAELPDELVAFVPLEAAALGSLQLLKFVAERLPAYMVPSRVVALEAFPLLPNGKLHLKLLSSGAVVGEIVDRAVSQVGLLWDCYGIAM